MPSLLSQQAPQHAARGSRRAAAWSPLLALLLCLCSCSQHAADTSKASAQSDPSASGGTSANAAGGSDNADGSGGSNGSSVEPTDPALRGAFVMVTNAHDAAFWKTAVARMASLGMSDVIIQTEAWLTQEGSLNAPTDDRLQAVLDSAAEQSIDVWIGLVLPEYGNGSLSTAQDESQISNIIAASKSSVDRVLLKFGSHSAFAGWYLPLELWTPDSEGLGYLPQYVSEVSRYAKTKKALPVLISPFISDLATSAELTESSYSSLLSDAKVDVVSVQDGVGARGVPLSELSTRVTPYIGAMQAACELAGCTTWVNVESFNSDGLPTTFDTLQQQLDAAANVSSAAVTYEFSNYWLTATAEPNELFQAYAATLP